jgi:glycogen operon protein
LYGSDDLFPDGFKDTRRPKQSITFITAHDGFCLYDLVAYNSKHNEANGHNNGDGADQNINWNCGWEGDEGAPDEVLALRRRQVKNFCALLMLSNGVPMMVAGDEFLNTQGGNNNPYNQDNETTWLDWALLEKNRDVFRFFKSMIAFRKAHPSIGRPIFWREDVKWFGPNGPVSFDFESRALAYLLKGCAVDDDDLYVMINAHSEEKEFVVQDGEASQWRRMIDTSRASPEDIFEPGEEPVLESLNYKVGARSLVVLRKPAKRSTPANNGEF